MYYKINMPRQQQAEYQKFAREKLGFEFHDVSLLVISLTHKSFVNEHASTHRAHNERLEFLGDAVLEIIVSDYLFRNYDQPEGVLTSWRAALVNGETNGETGIKLGYVPFVRMGKGENVGLSRAHNSIYSDCFEALIGAIYLDQGYDVTTKFVEKHVISKLPEILENETWRDSKSLLQEITQHVYNEMPIYQLVTMSGPDHDRSFTVRVIVHEKIYGIGSGHSKRDASMCAARVAIRRLKDEGLYEPQVYKQTVRKNDKPLKKGQK